METVKQILEEVQSEMCDKYCRYPLEEGHQEGWLFEDEDSPCNNCPLGRLC